MRLDWAKRIVLPILKRWSLDAIWFVEWPIDDSIVECRWFKSEQRARQFSATVANSNVGISLFDHKGPQPSTQEDFEVAFPFLSE